MKKFLVLILIVAVFTSCKKKNAWTPAYEKQIYTMVYDTLGSIMKDTVQRKDLTNFLVQRYKEALPGGIASIPGDSLRKLSSKIGREYDENHKAEDLKGAVAWSPAIEESLKKAIFIRLDGKATSEQSKAKYCDCVLANLKKMYPDSLVTPTPDSAVTRLNKDCAPLLTVK